VSKPKRYTIECVHAGTRREDPNGLWCAYSDVEKLIADNAVLTAKVDWLMKADRLVVWNGTEWEIRHVHNK